MTAETIGGRQNIECTDVELVDWDLHYDLYGTLRDANDTEIWGCVGGTTACGRLWTGIQEAHCAGCHQHFSSDSAFDKHQRLVHGECDHENEKPCKAKVVCLTPNEVGLVSREDKFGRTWARPGVRPGGLVS